MAVPSLQPTGLWWQHKSLFPPGSHHSNYRMIPIYQIIQWTGSSGRSRGKVPRKTIPQHTTKHISQPSLTQSLRSPQVGTQYMSKLLIERLGILWRSKLSIHPIPPGERRSAKNVRIYGSNHLLYKVSYKARTLLKMPEEPKTSLLCQYLYRWLIGHRVNKAPPEISTLA